MAACIPSIISEVFKLCAAAYPRGVTSVGQESMPYSAPSGQKRTEEDKILIPYNNDDGYYDLWRYDNENERH